MQLDKLFQKLVSLIVGFITRWYLLLALALILLAFVLTLLVRLNAIHLHMANIGGVEPNITYVLQSYLADDNLYNNPEKAPYTVTQYMPLHYLFSGGLAALLNKTASDPYGVSVVNRWVCLVLSLLLVVVNFLFLKFYFRLNWLGSLVFGLLVFPFISSSLYARPDALYTLFFCLSTFSAIIAFGKSTVVNLKWLVGAAILAALAFFTKQSGLILPIIAVGYLAVIAGQWKAAGYYLVSFMLSAVILYFLTVSVDFYTFYQNVIMGVDNGLNIPSFLSHFVFDYFQVTAVLLAIGLGFGVHALTKAEDKSSSFLGTSILVVAAFSSLSALKHGSNEHYFIQFLNLSIIALAYIFHHAAPPKLNGPWASIAKLSLLAFLVLSPLAKAVENYWQNKHVDNLAPWNTDHQVVDYLKNQKSLQPNQQVFMSYYDRSWVEGLLYGNLIMSQQEVVFCCTYDRKVYDYSNFHQALDNGEIRFILTSSPIQEQEFFIDNDYAQYELVNQIANYNIYEHKRYL